MSTVSELNKPFFQSIQTSFKDVSTTPGVETVGFANAAEGLVSIFDVLGNAAFTIVQGDLKGNIAKVRARYAKAPEQSGTLEDLVKNEMAENKGKLGTAGEGLMWLIRGLKFTLLGLQSSQNNPSEELAQSFTKAYEGSLKPHHGWVIKQAFGLAMKATPYRKDFYTRLGGPEAEVELKGWLAGLEKIVSQMESAYKSNGWGTV